MFLPLIYIILLSLIFVIKGDLFNKLIYTYILSDLFNQLNLGKGISLLGFSNFTYFDFLAYICIAVVAIKMFSIKNFKYYQDIKTITQLFIFILVYLTILIIFSFIENGTKGLQNNRNSIYSILFMAALIITMEKSFNYFSIMNTSLTVLTISIIIIYFLRLTGILNYYSGAYGSEENYSKYRFLINVQVVTLSIYYMNATVRRQYGVKLNTMEHILMYLSAFLVITSTQRMVTILFVAYLIIEIIFFTKKRFAILTVIIGIISILFLPERFTKMLEYAFMDVYIYEGSNAEGKMKDIPASTIALYEKGNIMFGNLFSEERLERSYKGFHSNSSRNIHNLFITYLYNGGILFALANLLLWLIIIKKLIKTYYIFNRFKGFSNEYLALILTCILSIIFLFLFNQSSGIGFFNSYYLGISVGVLLVARQQSILLKNKIIRIPENIS